MIGLVVQKPAKPLSTNQDGKPQLSVVLTPEDEAKFHVIRENMGNPPYTEVVRRLIRSAYANLTRQRKRMVK